MLNETLLVEIGTEELPPKALKQLSQALLSGVVNGLEKQGISFGDTHWFATPRRLSFTIDSLALRQPDQELDKKGPAVAAAFDSDGNPTRAAQGWAKSNGITVEQAQILETDKGKWLFHKALVKGKETSSLIPQLIKDAVKQLPIPKPMRWGWGTESFIRPVHNVLVMLGNDVVKGELFGLSFNNETFGHRFHANHPIPLSHCDEYTNQLRAHKVFADFDARTSYIKQELTRVADELSAKIGADDSLLEEVSALVEWPVILVASFDKSFLEVPKEALIYTMKGDQKYFPLLSNDGALTNQFAFVSNIESQNPETVIQGNEKVIRPRLSDAKFFYDQDIKSTLESRLDSLKKITFQNKLGSVFERSERLSKLSGYIAAQIGADPALAERAGLLSKADLTTNMVYEFPEVQGVMGRYYALNDKEEGSVALALEEQYLPRYAGDRLPSDLNAVSLALAEKIDTLVGIFGIGMIPKGDKDPFALRRAAIGLLRIATEGKHEFSFADVIGFAVTLFNGKLSNESTAKEVIQFVMGRCNAFYSEKSIPINVIQAVLACESSSLLNVDMRIAAVSEFSQLAESASLAAANKRVANILSKNSYSSEVTVNESLLLESEERALFDAISALNIDELSELRHYQSLLSQLAGLKDIIDGFFDNVMVMADDEEIKNNRLCLLASMRRCFLMVADIALLD